MSGNTRCIHACLLAGVRFFPSRASGSHVCSGVKVPTTTQPRRAHRYARTWNLQFDDAQSTITRFASDFFVRVQNFAEMAQSVSLSLNSLKLAKPWPTYSGGSIALWPPEAPPPPLPLTAGMGDADCSGECAREDEDGRVVCC